MDYAKKSVVVGNYCRVYYLCKFVVKKSMFRNLKKCKRRKNDGLKNAIFQKKIFTL